MVPDGWRQVRLGELFDSSKKKGKAGLPTMSVTLNDGLVRRESLDRKTDTNLEPEEHLLVKEGYIAYNMMRMWQGASGLASGDGLVSPAYVVLKPKPDVDPLFASYFFKAARSIYLFWAYSYGLTKDRLRLYFDDFSLIPTIVPSLEVQRRIGLMLSTWDRAMEAIDELIRTSEQEKRALMQRFFGSSESSNWPQVNLGSIGTFRKGKGIGRSQVTSDGLPCVTYGEIYTLHHTVIRSFLSHITPQTAEGAAEIGKGDLLFAGSGETPEEIGKCVAYIGNIPAYAGGDIVIYSPRNVNSHFLAYQLNDSSVVRQRMRFAQGQSVVHISSGNIANIKVRIPSVAQQEKITSTLSDIDSAIVNYRTQMQLLALEKKALMQQLLTGKRRVKIGKEQAA